MDEVVLGALVREGLVLLALRRRDKHAYPGVWDLPGGLVEDGETELDALARELHEELGVRIVPGSARHLGRVSVRSAAINAWLVRDWVGEPANTAPEEHDEIGWFALHELPPPVHAPLRTALLRALP